MSHILRFTVLEVPNNVFIAETEMTIGCFSDGWQMLQKFNTPSVHTVHTDITESARYARNYKCMVIFCDFAYIRDVKQILIKSHK